MLNQKIFIVDKFISDFYYNIFILQDNLLLLTKLLCSSPR